jgi:ubiquinone/menaquinone biosynthesis C-methylase UbiE
MTSYKTEEQVFTETVDVAGRHIVDVGCGGGEMIRSLRARGATAVGIECAIARLEAARAADPDHAGDYLEGVGEKLPLEDEIFDIATFFFSLHHVPMDRMKDALGEATRVLKPGGHLYVAEPDATGPSFDLDRLIDDESGVRAMAQSALARAPNLGLRMLKTLEYTSAYTYASATQFVDEMLTVNADRKAQAEANATQIAETFERVGTPVEGGRQFEQPVTVVLFRKE